MKERIKIDRETAQFNGKRKERRRGRKRESERMAVKRGKRIVKRGR